MKIVTKKMLFFLIIDLKVDFIVFTVSFFIAVLKIVMDLNPNRIISHSICTIIPPYIATSTLRSMPNNSSSSDIAPIKRTKLKMPGEIFSSKRLNFFSMVSLLTAFIINYPKMTPLKSPSNTFVPS